MKIQLDTTLKIIRIEEAVNLGEFINLLESLLPDGTWKEFKIETQNIINWRDPIIIPYAPYVPYTPQPLPASPYTQPWYGEPIWLGEPTTICKTDKTNSLVGGTFNIDVVM